MGSLSFAFVNESSYFGFNETKSAGGIAFAKGPSLNGGIFIV